MSTDDRVVVVTGAAGGLGWHVVRALADRGTRVVATDLDQDLLDERLKGVTGAAEITAVRADLTVDAEVAGVVRAAVDRWGRVDGLSNNAAVQGAVTPFVDYPEDEMWRIFRANFLSAWLTMKHCIPIMVDHGGGAIVNTGSSLAWRGQRDIAAYVSSKHALAGLTRCVAIEHGRHNVRANLLCPASMDTPMLATVADNVGDGDRDLGYRRLRALSPDGRLADPADVAAVAVYLLLDAPAHLSGVTLPVDGAETAG